MAKREVPDFDRVAAFDEALARQKPELVTRLGGPAVVATEEAGAHQGNDTASVAEPNKSETILKLIGPPDATDKRATKRAANNGTPRRGVVDRANGKQLRRLTVYVDLGLAQRLRKHCFEHELNLSEVAAEALNAGLEKLIKGA